jgi:hypothetical protein
VPRQARAFWLAVIVPGFVLAAWVLIGWRPQLQDLPRLGLYILAAIATSGLKVRLPGILSTLSMNYVFIIAGLIDLGQGGGILIATAGVLCQTFYKTKKTPQAQQVVFNFANIWLAVYAASYCFHHPILQSIDRFGVFPIVSASLAYFAVNTLILAGIIGLTSDNRVLDVWRE